MQYYKVEFTINSDGTITEKVLASGANCVEVTQALEQAIGEIKSQELLPEYNQPTDLTELSSTNEIWQQ